MLRITTLATHPTITTTTKPATTAVATTTATTTVAQLCPPYILSIVYPVHRASCQSCPVNRVLSISHSARSPHYHILPLLPLQLLAPVNRAFCRSRTCQLCILSITHPVPSPIATATTMTCQSCNLSIVNRASCAALFFNRGCHKLPQPINLPLLQPLNLNYNIVENSGMDRNT